ncbi:MAG: LamG-like jellyroll fold domain-containing protein [Flavobacteriales bacterium]|nr:LamG-like jellyroll fold domain-containing protein [Flavobacteriales bacterium]
MMKAYLISLFYLSSYFIYAQNDPTIIDQTRIGGSESDKISSIRQTADGGYIVAGSTESEDYDLEETTAFGGYDYWVVKLSSILNVQWSVRYGGSGDDFGEEVFETSDGSFLVGGTSNSPASAVKQDFWGGEDIWLIKLDSQGQLIWENTFGGTQDDSFADAFEESSGAFIVGGSSMSGATGNKLSAAQAVNFFDYWIIRIDNNGTKILDQSYGGTSNDNLYSIDSTLDGGYILGGSSYSGVNGIKTTNLIGGTDFWIIKLDIGFQPIWQYGNGTTAQDIVASVLQTSDGGFIVGGSFYGLGGLPNHENYEVIKLNEQGTESWSKSIVGNLWDTATCLDITNDGGFILSGYSNSDAGIDKDEAAINAAGGMDDFWIIKLDSMGNEEWQNTIGGFNADQPIEIHQTADGGYIIGSTTNSGYTADVEEYPIGNGFFSWDWWIVKLNSVIPFNAYLDDDGDGFGDPNNSVTNTVLEQGVLIAGDCNDSNPSINPAALEICNNLDDDCDGSTDEYDFDYILELNGVDEYLNCGGDLMLAPTNQLTVECWAYRSVWTGSDKSIVSKTQNGGYAIETSGTGVAGHVFRNGAYGSVTSGTLATGWHHFALTYDGRFTKLYVDGILSDTNDASAIFPIAYSCAGNNFLIGAEPTCGGVATNNKFNGKIDEVRLWSYARNAIEITSNKNHPIDGNTPGLISYFTMFPVQVGNFVIVTNQAVAPGASVVGTPNFLADVYFNEGAPELCNGVDDNCNGQIDEGFVDIDSDGVAECAGDCNDAVAGINPFAPEVCNSIDDDCDGQTDEHDFGNALQLNGTTDYVNCGGSTLLAPTEAITVEVWAFRYDWSGIDKAILSKTQTGGYSIYTNETGLETYLHRGGAYAILQHTTPVASGWHHIAITFDGRYTRLYVDGVESDMDDALSNVPITYLCNDNNLLIGNEPTCTGVASGNPEFNGSIDEVRLWNYARSEFELNRFMTHELFGNENGLLAYWKFNELGTGAGITALNSANTGSELNGITVGNSTTFVQSKIYNTSTTYYADFDLDGYGNPNNSVQSCTGISTLFSLNNLDCDDSRSDVYPNAPGTDEGIDNNCNGTIDLLEQLAIPGDFDGNGVVNTPDLLLFVSTFGCSSSCGSFDLDGNGTVNTNDLLIFISLMGG